jgi:hypothetical protein
MRPPLSAVQHTGASALAHLPAAKDGLVAVCEHAVVGSVVRGPARCCRALQAVVQLLPAGTREHLRARNTTCTPLARTSCLGVP